MFLASLKSKTILILKRLKDFLVKFKYLIIIFLVLLTVPPFLIETGFQSLINQKEIEAKIDSLNKENSLNLSYDGFNKGSFYGIVFYNARISIKDENLKNANLVSIPELILKPDLLESFKNKKIVINKILFKDARWEINASSNNLRGILDENLQNILKKYADFNIYLKNNILSLTFEKKNYEREKWNIKIKEGIINSENGKAELTLKYNDSPWGRGSLNFHPDLCDKCSIISGKFIGKINDLPVNRLSWFFKDYKLKDGTASLNFSLNLLSQDNKFEYESRSSVSLKDPDITSLEDKPVLDFKKLRIDFSLENKNKIFQSDFSGNINESIFQGSLEQKEGSLLPEKFKLNLENKGKYVFPLYYGYKLKGLNSLSLDIAEKPEDRNVYREISGNLKITNGILSSLNSDFSIGLPNVSFSIDKNEFNGNIQCQKGDSDLSFDLKGNFVPIFKKITTQLEFEDYLRNRTIDMNALVWNIKEEGSISGKQLYWNDFNDLYKRISQKWLKSIYSDTYKGWRPSILRERKWFQSYLMYSTFKNNFSIGNWAYEKRDDSDKEETPLDGSLSFNGALFEALFNSKDNKLDMKIDASSNYPIIKGEFIYSFQGPNEFSKLWLPPKFGMSYSNYSINATFFTSGEKPVEIDDNFKASYEYSFNNIKLPDEIDKENKNWDKIEMSLKRYGSKVSINYQGENDNTYIKGWGAIDENESAEWKTNTSYAKKLNRIN